ncbi:5'-phosphate synthase pdxT subunit [Friedmanniella endophytica]|uniref:Pyridoxal 5'-phosphate synthase subunit PdxT n=1 Tax=Microlunatus kandeliicorticis TaxID=1759536 RepID=A0A7W3P6K1_9ACTN|nr:pyridoxal 5'-phosphate synthase glutaminase subunit PdxT [Microlunatus kandeliicorticis]MBA8795136.1 5'-phosphate synthase pdxT subunit [Microlunatus kandeliicorticis]
MTAPAHLAPGEPPTPRIGVLALQGDVREHLAALSRCGADAVPVRRPGELVDLDAIVLPGGESTTIDKLSVIFEVREPLIARLRAGMPAYGSCAGMIMLADRVLDGRPDQRSFGGLDVTVRRNAFGRQVDSFEDDLQLDGITGPAAPFHAIFIRAPWVEAAGPGVRVLGTAAGHPVAVETDTLLATSFHPEVGGDDRVHAYFVAKVRATLLAGLRAPAEDADRADGPVPAGR